MGHRLVGWVMLDADKMPDTAFRVAVSMAVAAQDPGAPLDLSDPPQYHSGLALIADRMPAPGAPEAAARRVRRGVAELVRLGYLRRERVTGPGKPNVYALLFGPYHS